MSAALPGSSIHSLELVHYPLRGAMSNLGGFPRKFSSLCQGWRAADCLISRVVPESCRNSHDA